ncbi:hypothetical protein Vadar_031262 [Vaccinium darrowii]|uniref:Uncharacterized protein n=1 Tax=Vaccinium darrowii TaxID=229202 RepID=A0ACB7Y9T7_9ERIC|nr:hypothetical protein Vadar_031262 [Vaccinium darrowii]
MMVNPGRRPSLQHFFRMADLEMPFRVRRTRRPNFGWDTERPESMSDIFDQRPLQEGVDTILLRHLSRNLTFNHQTDYQQAGHYHSQLKGLWGIYTGRLGLDDLFVGKHVVVVTGYGRKTRGPLAGTEFFRIKNSSGEEWGKRGYGKIKCSLLFDFVYAIIGGMN